MGLTRRKGLSDVGTLSEWLRDNPREGGDPHFPDWFDATTSRGQLMSWFSDQMVADTPPVRRREVGVQFTPGLIYIRPEYPPAVAGLVGSDEQWASLHEHEGFTVLQRDIYVVSTWERLR